MIKNAESKEKRVMPNWCENTVNITFPTVKEKKRFIKESSKKFEGKRGKGFSFDALIPMPKELSKMSHGAITIGGKRYSHWIVKNGTDVGISNVVLDQLQRKYGADNWRDWANENWDTKWDVHGDVGVYEQPKLVRMYFDTAWSPRSAVYDYIYKNFDCSVHATFDEPGVGYYGTWVNGVETVRDYTDEDHERGYGIFD